MALDAAKLLLDSPEKIADVLKNPLHPDPTFSFFGIPVVVSERMPPGKIAFVSYKRPSRLPFREIADIKVFDVEIEEEPEKC